MNNNDELVKYLISRIESIDFKVDSLVAFKWQIFGGSALVVFLITLAMQVFFH